MGNDGVPVVPVKVAHINLMTDTILLNMPPEGLRSIFRSILVADPSLTTAFHAQSRKWLEKTRPASMPQLFTSEASASSKKVVTPSSAFEGTQRRIRAMFGCGLGFESLELLSEIVVQVSELDFDGDSEEGERLTDILATIDGDIVQAVTAAGKELLVGNTKRCMNSSETAIQEGLLRTLEEARNKAEAKGLEFMFDRGLSVAEKDNF